VAAGGVPEAEAPGLVLLARGQESQGVQREYGVLGKPGLLYSA